jgi:chromosome segregation ATPase
VEDSAVEVPAVAADVFQSNEKAEPVEAATGAQLADTETIETVSAADGEETSNGDDQSADGNENSNAPLKSDGIEPREETPSVVTKIARIREQISSLEEKERVLQRRLESFSQPLSGSVAKQLSEATRTMDAISSESKQVEQELDDATKQLAVWYGQEQRLKSTEILKLASEVAALSKPVEEQKKRFEDVTWRYLKEREGIQYDPNNEELKSKVEALVEERKKELKELNAVVRTAIAEEMNALDNSIADLTAKKARLKDDAAAAAEELEYVQALMSQDPDRQAATSKRFHARLADVQSEKQSLQELVDSLYEDALLFEP